MVDLNNKHLCNQEKTGDDGFDSERKRNQLKFTKDDRYLKESSIGLQSTDIFSFSFILDSNNIINKFALLWGEAQSYLPKGNL